MERTQAIGIAEPVAEPSLVVVAPVARALEANPTALTSAIPLDARPPEEHVVHPTSETRDNRAFDVTVALALLLLVLPLLFVCVLLVRCTSRGPLIYRQSRIGLNGQPFDCLKLRTMVVDADCAIDGILADSPEAHAEWRALQKFKCDPRVTPVGTVLRRYCLDELPQLFNVLAGDMCVVGPRPIVADEIDRFGLHFADYCSVKPGLTGLWQVSGRHQLSYEERVRLDAEYARSKCLSLDLRILCKTMPVVLLGQNG